MLSSDSRETFTEDRVKKYPSTPVLWWWKQAELESCCSYYFYTFSFSKKAGLKYQILFILYQLVRKCCRDVVLLILLWNITVWARNLGFNASFFWKLAFFCIAHARNFGHVTSLIMHDMFFSYVKSNLYPFWQKGPIMEAIFQIIRSVGLFVSSRSEVFIYAVGI